MKILVTGATGYIGGRLVGTLIFFGHQVRVLVREPRKLARRNWPGVEIFKGDVTKPETLLEALKGVDVAYYLVHSMGAPRGDFAKKDREGAENFAEAANSAGVKRIIYLGGLGSGEGLSEHLKSRHDTGTALRSAGVPVTELRAAIIVGSGSASFAIIHDLVKKLPFMICPRWVNSKCEPIAVRQVIAYLIGVLDEPRSVGETLDIGGGEILTYKEMMEQCAEVMGRKLYVLTVPVLTPRLSSYWLNLVTQVPIGLARPLVEGLRNDVVTHDHRIREWIRVPEISYRQAVRLALEKMKRNEIESSWTDANTSRSSFIGEPRGNYFEDRREAFCNASPERVFQAIERIGGAHGWYHADWLWNLRAGMDWLIGGIGMRRGRPDPDKLEVGDPVDFWRVEDKEQDRSLVLRAEMKLPGTARLIFNLMPHDGGTLLEMKAHFWPSKFFGKLYWYSVMPLHNYVFEGMIKGIQKESEKLSNI
jgi:uncharacterized protein YbjT (DUF2867 family)